jgi:hypothetical protein
MAVNRGIGQWLQSRLTAHTQAEAIYLEVNDGRVVERQHRAEEQSADTGDSQQAGKFRIVSRA